MLKLQGKRVKGTEKLQLPFVQANVEGLRLNPGLHSQKKFRQNVLGWRQSVLATHAKPQEIGEPVGNSVIGGVVGSPFGVGTPVEMLIVVVGNNGIAVSSAVVVTGTAENMSVSLKNMCSLTSNCSKAIFFKFLLSCDMAHFMDIDAS